jgi:hypothetical protein
MAKNKTAEGVGFSICLDSLCTLNPTTGAPEYFARGERVHSDHWAVAQAAPFFADDGEPDSHYRNLLSNLYGAHAHAVE